MNSQSAPRVKAVMPALTLSRARVEAAAGERTTPTTVIAASTSSATSTGMP
jgi:phosphoribosylpyrophosphate synthetase